MNLTTRFDVLRRWPFWFVVAAAVVAGFGMFCLPELRLKTSDPNGWRIMWGSSRVSTCTRCIVFSLLEGAGAAAVVIAIYALFPSLRRVKRL